MSCSDGITTAVLDRVSDNPTTGEGPTDAEVRTLLLPMIIFVLISVADTISSVYMLMNGMMEEYNPLMRWVWESGGVTAFVAVKACLTIMPIWLFNKLKFERCGLVRRALWVTVFGYATIYCIFFVIANY
ncbi:MAG TPA: DUF5658 family protein [Armatimonadota bacterium]|nr:DUF5658 family protein [Armatimonadota bacterium]